MSLSTSCMLGARSFLLPLLTGKKCFLLSTRGISAIMQATERCLALLGGVVPVAVVLGVCIWRFIPKKQPPPFIFPAYRNILKEMKKLEEVHNKYRKEHEDQIHHLKRQLKLCLDPVEWISARAGLCCETRTDTITPFIDVWTDTCEKKPSSLETLRTIAWNLLDEKLLDDCWRQGQGNCTFHVRKYIEEIETSLQAGLDFELLVISGKTVQGDEHTALCVQSLHMFIFVEASFAFKVKIEHVLLQQEGKHKLRTDQSM